MNSIPIMPPGKLAVRIVKQLKGEEWMCQHVFSVGNIIENKTNRVAVPKELVGHLQGRFNLNVV